MSVHLPPAISISLFRLNMPQRCWEGTQLQERLGLSGELSTECQGSSPGRFGVREGRAGLKGPREQGCSLPHSLTPGEGSASGKGS